MRVDFHRHLEGSHTARALLAVARAHDLRDDTFYDAARGRHRTVEELAPTLGMQGPPGDAAAFYQAIERGRRAYVSVAAIADLAYETFLDAAAEVDALELRASLFSMTRTLLGPQWRAVAPLAFAERAREVLLGLLAARDRAQVTTGKRLLVRIGLSRTFESEAHYRAMGDMMVEHAEHLCGLDVLGILMTGDKEPLEAGLVAVIERLRPVLPDLTIHAGEFEDHRSVARALALSPRGIGHGIRAVGSSEVMARLAEAGVTLEVCPSSNDLLVPEAVASLRALHGGAHPLCTLQRHHVHAVLGSDDPVSMRTDFPSEEARAHAEGVDVARLAADTARRWAELTGHR